MTTLAGKTLFITGASRGIGRAIALRAARDGANVVVVAKTVTEHAKLPGTIHSVASEIEAAGGKALAVQVDIRDELQIAGAVAAAVTRFGGIDILVNNASAIFLAGTTGTPMKRFDLMQAVNTRATYACSQACIPHLERAANPHILMLSPPISLDPVWLQHHLAYTISKYGMSLCVIGLAAELKNRGIAVNALWPKTIIATAAIHNLLGGEAAMKRARKPEIVADAAHAIVCRDSRVCSGAFFLDEDVLAAEGVQDLSDYAVASAEDLQTDLFIDPQRSAALTQRS